VTPDGKGESGRRNGRIAIVAGMAGGGWLIFALPPAELAAHSTSCS
jgi:hypothetical protein